MLKQSVFCQVVIYFSFCGVSLAVLPNFTGQVTAQPQQILTDWEVIEIGAAGFEFTEDIKSHNAVKLAKELIQERFNELAKENKVATERKIVIHIGDFNSEVIKLADKKFGLNFNKLVLPSQGYAIRKRISDDGIVNIIIAGVDHRGTFYGAMTLLQLTGSVDGKLVLKIADIDDWPTWTKRYVTDRTTYGEEHLTFLAKNKINGYAVQHRANWRDFSPDGETGSWKYPNYKAGLSVMKEFKDKYDLIDYMALIHIYVSSTPKFNIADENDIMVLAENCIFAAENGVSFIVIGVDDGTPHEKGNGYVCPHESERKKFNNSVGLAHGYLMKRIHSIVKQNFPEVDLGFVTAPYSTYDHNVPGDVTNQKYLRDFAMVAPDDIYVIWTGPRVFSEDIKREDFLLYSKFVPNHRTFIWDNTVDLIRPIPYWNTKYYEGFAVDSQGIMFDNAFVFGRDWLHQDFALVENAYLWNQKNFDAEKTHKDIFEKWRAFGKYDLVKEFYKLQQAIKSTDDVTTKRKLYDDLFLLVDEFKKNGLSIKWILDCLEAEKAAVYVEVPEITVHKISTPPVIDGVLDDNCWKDTNEIFFVDSTDKGLKVGKTLVKFGYDDNNLYIGMEAEWQAIPVSKKYAGKRDNEVYTSSDAIEIFLKPNKDGSYGQFVFDFMENIYDSKDGCAAGSYDPVWNVKVKKQKEKWTAEVVIPFDSLKELKIDKPGKDVVWKANLCRDYNAFNQSSCWSPTYSNSFHNQTFWGKIKFSD